MPASSHRSRAASALRDFTARHGRRTLAILAVILLVGGAFRFERVINPNTDPGDDAYAYMDLARALYEEQSYGSAGFGDPTDWSPGAPLIYAASYYATFGARDGTARLTEALLGIAGIFLVFLLGRRLAGPDRRAARGRRGRRLPTLHLLDRRRAQRAAGLFLFARGDPRLPLGAGPRRDVALAPAGRAARRHVPDPPEYMPVAFVLILVALATLWRERGPRPAAAATAALAIAFALAIVPWTVRNYIALDRVVPISTGSGKALYVGTSLPNDGEYYRVKAVARGALPGTDAGPRLRGA